MRAKLTLNHDIVLITGVAGSGKTSLGRFLASRLGWLYFEADDFHPSVNIQKMSLGVPLSDSDRWPWLRAIRAKMDEMRTNQQRAIFTCSALKADYRSVLLTPEDGRTLVVFLSISYELALRRIDDRSGHFMKSSLLESQFSALEVPDRCLRLDAADTLEQNAHAILSHL